MYFWSWKIKLKFLKKTQRLSCQPNKISSEFSKNSFWGFVRNLRKNGMCKDREHIVPHILSITIMYKVPFLKYLLSFSKNSFWGFVRNLRKNGMCKDREHIVPLMVSITMFSFGTLRECYLITLGKLLHFFWEFQPYIVFM